MKPLTPEERRIALQGLVDCDDGSEFEVLDRSTLQNWATCPFMASALESGKVNLPAVVPIGQEVHEAIARATLDYVESDGQLSPGDLKNNLIAELRGSRPDVQSQVIAAGAASAWSWASFLTTNIHPGNILGFDGGEVIGRGGQLAMDFTDLRKRTTSELDLLYSTESDELLAEIDYKTGFKYHDAASVANSFQFQFHAALVFTNFPSVNALQVVAWNTFTNSRSYRVTFKREDLPEYTARIRMAIQSYVTNRDNPPTWPTWEKCSTCSAAAICPESGQDIGDVAKDPAAVVNQLIAVEAKAAAIKKALSAYVDSRKQDIQAGAVCFGRNKPRTERKAPAAIYEPKGESQNGDGD